MTIAMYLIAYILVIATFFNDGFTRMFFSVPFVFFIIADSLIAKKHTKLIINVIALSILYILAITRYSNPYIYPVLNQSIITTQDYVLVNYYHDSQILVDIIDQKDSMDMSRKGKFGIYKETDLYQEYLLKKGSLIKPVKVLISGHPDIMGISYKLQIDINDTKLKSKIQRYILSHYNDLNFEINSKLPQDMQQEYIAGLNDSTLNKDDNFYAGEWFFDNFPEENRYYSHIKSRVERFLGQVVMIFNPFFIWVYLIILYLQIKYLNNMKRKNNLT